MFYKGCTTKTTGEVLGRIVDVNNGTYNENKNWIFVRERYKGKQNILEHYYMLYEMEDS